MNKLEKIQQLVDVFQPIVSMAVEDRLDSQQILKLSHALAGGVVTMASDPECMNSKHGIVVQDGKALYKVSLADFREFLDDLESGNVPDVEEYGDRLDLTLDWDVTGATREDAEQILDAIDWDQVRDAVRGGIQDAVSNVLGS